MHKPLVVIIGPTCVGKTKTSIYLAERLNGEIISADSRTFYKGMDIGTAKPSIEEMQRVPHHLVDIVSPDNQLNLVVFQQLARSTIAEIYSRDHIPFLVGGTGQYIRSVTKNWSPPTAAPDHHLRQVLEDISAVKGNEYLYQVLKFLDPEAAAIIDLRNVRRTIRAIEVIFKTGKLFSLQRQANTSQYDLITIGLTRSRIELYSRIDQRIEDMFSKGFVQEVRILLNSGLSPYLPAFSAIGYPECIAVVSGRITEEEAIKEIKRKTRIFVRRQANWFKPTDPTIEWFDISKRSGFEIEDFIRSSL
jgi:tRNA dimethylallyltransferase